MALFEAYLAQSGHISVPQLANALAESNSAQPALSSVALRGGFLSAKQVGAVRAHCNANGKTFEQAAIDLDFLSSNGVRSIIEMQLSMFRPPTEWLLSSKAVDADQLEELRSQFVGICRAKRIDEARLSALDRRASVSLSQALEQLQSLKPFPKAASRVVNLLKHEGFQLEDVVREFEQDPVLTGRLLDLANSAVFSTGAPCPSINQALTRLGARKIRDVVYSLAFFGLFDTMPKEAEDVRAHSAGVAAIARALAVHTAGANRDLAFLSGLMHDVGKLVLLKASLNPPGAPWAPRSHHQTHLNQSSVCDEELELLGFDHSLLSVLCLRAWGFPDSCCELVAEHHAPTSSDNLTQLGCEILVTADALEHTMAAGGDREQVTNETSRPVALTGWTNRRLGDYWPLLEEARNDSIGALNN